MLSSYLLPVCFYVSQPENVVIPLHGWNGVLFIFTSQITTRGSFYLYSLNVVQTPLHRSCEILKQTLRRALFWCSMRSLVWGIYVELFGVKASYFTCSGVRVDPSPPAREEVRRCMDLHVLFSISLSDWLSYPSKTMPWQAEQVDSIDGTKAKIWVAFWITYAGVPLLSTFWACNLTMQVLKIGLG